MQGRVSANAVESRARAVKMLQPAQDGRKARTSSNCHHRSGLAPATLPVPADLLAWS